MARTTTGRGSIQRDWLAKVSAGALLGLSLALASSGLFTRMASGMVPGLRAQLAMWMVAPIWLAVLGGCFLFRTGKRAWLWLGVVNLVLFAALAAARLS
jgi:hypothetical protein